MAITVRNDWSNLYVVFGLLLVGLGQGALSTLLFNVLVTSSPKELAGDVGALQRRSPDPRAQGVTPLHEHGGEEQHADEQVCGGDHRGGEGVGRAT